MANTSNINLAAQHPVDMLYSSITFRKTHQKAQFLPLIIWHFIQKQWTFNEICFVEKRKEKFNGWLITAFQLNACVCVCACVFERGFTCLSV